MTAVVCTHWAEGGKGAEALAQRGGGRHRRGQGGVQAALSRRHDAARQDQDDRDSRSIGAGEVAAPKAITDRLAEFEKHGFGNLPICMAKTQYSFSANPDLRGAPSGFELPMREVRLSAGAEFVVAICGDIMTMPGLPRVPSAEAMFVNEAGQIIGLS